METRTYNIEEVLEFPEGTEFVNSKGYKVTVNEGHILCYIRDGEIENDAIPLSLYNVTTKYKLIYKRLNFFEAMKLVDEGKIVYNSEYDDLQYKKVDGVLKMKNKNRDNCYYEIPNIDHEEIITDWFEVLE